MKQRTQYVLLGISMIFWVLGMISLCGAIIHHANPLHYEMGMYVLMGLGSLILTIVTWSKKDRVWLVFGALTIFFFLMNFLLPTHPGM